MQQTPRSGFTLVELMVATAILVMVIGAAFGFWRFFSEGYSFSLRESQSAFEAEMTLARLVREIRQVKEAETGAYAIEEAGDFILVYYADANDDGVVDRVRYWVEGSEFWRGVTQPSGEPLTYDLTNERRSLIADTVINEVHEPVFTYFNQNWPADTVNNPLPPASRQLATRFIQINLKLRSAEEAGAPRIDVTSGVALRTLKSNL